MNKILKLKFNPNNAKDRRDFFKFSCDLLAKDPEKEAAALKITSTAAGYTVNLDSLVAFIQRNSLKIDLNWMVKGDAVATVLCPEVTEVVGKVAQTNPDAIKETSVDKKDPMEGFESINSESEGTGNEMSPLPEDLTNKDEDDPSDLFG